MEEGSLFFAGKNAVHLSLRKIAKRLDELGIPYAVAGGMALYLHGFRRFTDDVDILVTRESRKEIQRRLSGLGFVPPFERSKNLRDTETGVKIEFLTTGEYPGDGKEKPVAFPDPSDVSVERDGIRVLNLETLVQLKIASGISGAGRRKDLGDVQELIKLLALPRAFGERLDAYVRPAFEQLWDEVFGRRKRFIALWPSGASEAPAQTIDDLVRALPEEADRLTAMKDDGIVVEPEPRRRDGFICLVTYDPAVATKWGLEDESEFEDEDDSADGE